MLVDFVVYSIIHSIFFLEYSIAFVSYLYTLFVNELMIVMCCLIDGDKYQRMACALWRDFFKWLS